MESLPSLESTTIKFFDVEVPNSSHRTKSLFRKAHEAERADNFVIHLLALEAAYSFVNTALYTIQAIAIATFALVRCRFAAESDRVKDHFSYAGRSFSLAIHSLQAILQTVLCCESLFHQNYSETAPATFIPPPLSPESSSATPRAPAHHETPREEPSHGATSAAALPSPREPSSDRLSQYARRDSVTEDARLSSGKSEGSDFEVIEEDDIGPLPKKRGWLERAGNFIIDPNHPSKQMKYASVLTQYKEHLHRANIKLDEEIRWTTSQRKTPLIEKYEAIFRLLNGERYLNPRDEYQTFVRELEALIDSREYQDECKLSESHIRIVIRELCRIRWCLTSLHPYLYEVVGMVRATYVDETGERLTGELSAEGFADYLMNANREVERAPVTMKKEGAALAGQKLTGTLGLKHFTADENTPHLRHTQVWEASSGRQEIFYVRHGSPTTAGSYMGAATGIGFRLLGYESGNTAGEKVCSSYREMIRGQAELRRSVFVTVLQRNVEDTLENEKARVQEIIAEQDQHENFHVLVQDLEGPFFKREEGYAQILDFESFKKAVIHAFNTSTRDTRVVLPQALIEDRESYIATLGRLFDFVHERFFEKKPNLEEGDWQNFLLLFYAVQRAELKFRLSEKTEMPVGVYSTFCKDFLDRGGVVSLIEDMMMALLTGEFGQRDWMENEIAQIIGPAIAVKKQGVIEGRLVLAQNLYPILFALSQNQARLQAFKQEFPLQVSHGFSLSTVQIPPAPGQRAMPDSYYAAATEEASAAAGAAAV